MIISSTTFGVIPRGSILENSSLYSLDPGLYPFLAAISRALELSSYLSIPVLKGDYLYVKVSEIGTPDSYSEALTINGIRYAGSSLDEVSSYTGPFGSEKTFRLRIKDSYIFSNTPNSTNTIAFEARVPFSMQVLSKSISVHVE
ncbi:MULTISPECIES: hypothetical protein [Bacillus]|uniref:hypothetical protein n=1 Tax=Bacillus TaxID=1386 RepID=UPI000B4516F6|nr:MULTISPECIES: hypothetical protein [Bacillus cereus group]MEC4602395.1 hypothetical protein [Bacillus paranthracis]OTY08433.1 hypothetical protein BK731_08380 [Bacillus thuringiensis serovar muju]